MSREDKESVANAIGDIAVLEHVIRLIESNHPMRRTSLSEIVAYEFTVAGIIARALSEVLGGVHRTLMGIEPLLDELERLREKQ